jgi:hypothetical protein
MEPSSRFIAISAVPPFSLPIVKMRPPEIATLDMPLPKPDACQESVGPSSGHSCSRPFSVEIPSRLGPRQLGHSAVGAFNSAASPISDVSASANNMTAGR